MFIYLFILIPVFTLVYLMIFYRSKVVWWEALLVLLVPTLVIIGIKVASQGSRMFTTEYWNSYSITAEYYEDWDEEVPCGHPIYSTRSYTDSQGNTHTETYISGYMHAYDVDYHPSYWVLLGNSGESIGIPENKFISLSAVWGNKSFVDLKRDYHSNDGDKYVTKWNGAFNTIEPIASKHTYKNKVKCSKSVFNFRDIDPKVTKVYEYPELSGYACNYIYGWGNASDQILLRRWNALIGRQKKVVIMVIPYLNRPLIDAFDQESYWKGGNKNEFIACVGISSTTIAWSKVISWTPETTLKAQVERELREMKKFSMPEIINYLGNTIQNNKNCIRRDFNEFNYLSVPVPLWGYIVAFILSLASSILLAYLVVNNYVNAE